LIKGRPSTTTTTNNNNNNNNKAKCIPGGTLRVLAGKNDTYGRTWVTSHGLKKKIQYFLRNQQHFNIFIIGFIGR
jgi:hypothetical protein